MITKKQIKQWLWLGWKSRYLLLYYMSRAIYFIVKPERLSRGYYLFSVSWSVTAQGWEDVSRDLVLKECEGIRNVTPCLRDDQDLNYSPKVKKTDFA